MEPKIRFRSLLYIGGTLQITRRISYPRMEQLDFARDSVVVMEDSERELERRFHDINNSFVDRLSLSFRPEDRPFLYYLRANADDLQCHIGALHLEYLLGEVEHDTEGPVDYALVEFLGVHLKPRIYEMSANKEFREDYAMLFTYGALRSSVKQLVYKVSESRAIRPLYGTGFSSRDIVERGPQFRVCFERRASVLFCAFCMMRLGTAGPGPRTKTVLNVDIALLGVGLARIHTRILAQFLARSPRLCSVDSFLARFSQAHIVCNLLFRRSLLQPGTVYGKKIKAAVGGFSPVSRFKPYKPVLRGASTYTKLGLIKARPARDGPPTLPRQAGPGP